MRNFIFFRIMLHGRAQGTTTHHNRVIRDYQEYMMRRRIPTNSVSEQLLLEYLTELQELKKPHGFCTQVKGSIKSMLAMLQVPESTWSLSCQRMCDALIRVSAEYRTRMFRGRI